MRCTLAKNLIPLFVSDDLPDEQMSSLREHIEACEACRQLADELSDSQLWLRTLAVPEFPEAIFADLRDGVQQQIVRAQPGKSWFQWLVPDLRPRFVLTAAAAAALLLVAVFAIYLVRHQTGPKNDGISGGAKAHNKITTPQTVVYEKQSGKVREGRENGEPKRPGTGQNKRSAKHRSLPLPIPQQLPELNDVATADIPKDREMLRIELQTADPKIRIIWFAPMPDTSSTDQSNTK